MPTSNKIPSIEILIDIDSYSFLLSGLGRETLGIIWIMNRLLLSSTRLSRFIPLKPLPAMII